MKNKLTVSWIIFICSLILFVSIVELLHRTKSEQLTTYQYRILIDKDLAIEETEPEEKNKISNINLYEKTIYGVLPKKQNDYMKIFNAYSSNIDYVGNYIKIAIVLSDENSLKIKQIIENFKHTKISFIIPHYIKEIDTVINTILETGNEFFIQLPLQSSIPIDKINKVSPFLANASTQDNIDKLNYLIASAKYAIGIAIVSTSNSLFTKSKKDIELITNELSQRGMSILYTKDNDTALNSIDNKIKCLCLEAKLFEKNISINSGESFILNDTQINEFLKILPENIKCVPISFKVKNATL